MAKEIRVPTLGESVTEATIGQWFKKTGEAVADGETLVELETDKVTLEVPSPGAGTLGEIVANEGDTVEVDALLGSIAGRRRRRGANLPRKQPSRNRRNRHPNRNPRPHRSRVFCRSRAGRSSANPIPARRSHRPPWRPRLPRRD
jgi:pyruvate/2-oxoglutarate dehydrogenase complex dihydrolipoamide acyltransferase (E2) component